ncbi:MAG: ParB N-terminal domain-containing protein [Brevundimonas sp.]|uniref:ParB N-terminal domain-containing protein n=1 Tax=Brevundimonas sp. TaxID=1871086 RepID=UPI001A19C7BF|nr:ParB N-terminal domain-containing protein [Brevundimonas sp.]MBJ7447529.1 ParB N-terminal domain-containing protein [Brevundimonas sp.]
MHTAEIPIQDLLLDPNNYRIQEITGFALTADERLHVEQVQAATKNRLQSEGLKALRSSILANGFLPIERIVVTPYAHDAGKFLVIEGNRRVAALQSIKESADAGIEVRNDVLEVLKAVPCVVVESSPDFPHFKQTLMGVRHVGGIKSWGGYQKAKLIADLKDDGLESSVVAERLGLEIQEVNRRYRAYKALQQMQGDEDFGEYATPSLYPLFHEAISVPNVREWLGWNGSSFTDASNRENFYSLLVPYYDDEKEEIREPKITKYSDVRSLKDIMRDPDALSTLLSSDGSLLDALTIAKKDELSKKWLKEVREARRSLEQIGVFEVKKLSADDLKAIGDLKAVTDQVLEIHATLATT